MEKKIEKVSSLLNKLGLTPRELIVEWVRDGIVNMKEIQADLERMKNETVFVSSFGEITAGMFLYANGKISNTYSEKECCALVLDVIPENSELLMLSLQKVSVPFCSQGFVIDTDGILRGINATHFLSQMADGDGATVGAAQYCLEFSNAFVSAGMAYLMTEREVRNLEKNLQQIVPALKAANVFEGGFGLSTTAEVDENTKTTYAKVGVFMPDRIAVQKEVGTIPLAVYPVFSLSSSHLAIEE